MKITEKQIRSLEISGVEALDSIRVHLENTAPGKGRITIECFGESWASFWPAMGDTIEQFFCRCDNAYLIGNLDGSLHDEIDDYDALTVQTRRKISALRREHSLSRHEARELWDACEDIPNGPLWSEPTLAKVYGDEFLHDLVIPQKANPDYAYLSRIVDAVKVALKKTESAQALEAAA